MKTIKEDYLQHYGILGMKWGKRKSSSKSNGGKGSKVRKVVSKIKNKKKVNIKKLPDEELQKKIRRLQMEKQYRDLKRDEVSEGRKIVGRILSNTAVRLGSDALYSVGGMGINKATGINLINSGKKKKNKDND